jgi:hypothetical protein
MVFHFFFVNLIFKSLFSFSFLLWYNYTHTYLLLIKYSCLCYVYVIVLYLLNKFLCWHKKNSFNCWLYDCYVFFSSSNRCCRQLVHCSFSHLNSGGKRDIYVGWPLSKHKKNEGEEIWAYIFSFSCVYVFELTTDVCIVTEQ